MVTKRAMKSIGSDTCNSFEGIDMVKKPLLGVMRVSLISSHPAAHIMACGMIGRTRAKLFIFCQRKAWK